MRRPLQVLVFVYRETAQGRRYLLLRRRDLGCWQGIAGGAEGDEAPIDAAIRESREEVGAAALQLLPLDSCCTIPVALVCGFLWGDDVLVVPEHTFGMEVAADFEVKLSDEHTDFKWCSYEAATQLLSWDSNKSALWELNYRLEHGLLPSS